MKYTVEMDSGAMIYIPSFINWFRHSKADRGGGYTDIRTTCKMHKPASGM
jgi:hypothetical protein